MKVSNMRVPGETIMKEQAKMLVDDNFLELHNLKNQRKVFTTITRYS